MAHKIGGIWEQVCSVFRACWENLDLSELVTFAWNFSHRDSVGLFFQISTKYASVWRYRNLMACLGDLS